MLAVNQHLIIIKKLPMCKTLLRQGQAWRYSSGLQGLDIAGNSHVFKYTARL